MNLIQVSIPQYDPKTGKGNYNPGRGGASADEIVIHWMDGTLGDADKVFANRDTVHSAHFGVEDENVHQYVRLSDTAFHAGIYAVNQRSIGIEYSAQPGRDASDTTYETSSQLIVQIARQVGKPVSSFQFRRHGEIVSTQCCGTVDVNRISSRALEIETAAVPPKENLASATVSIAVHLAGYVTAKAGLNVRTEPSATAPILRTMVLGQGFWYSGTVSGSSVNGNATWLVLEDGHYCWSGATNYKPSISNA